VFSLGISFGAYWVNNLTLESKDLLIKYLNGFFALIPANTLSSFSILKASLANNMLSIILLLVFGLTYLGIAFSPLYAIFKGFCFGFSIAFLVRGFGKKGLIFSIASLLPHCIISIPGTIFLCTISLQYSLYILKSRSEIRYEKKSQNLINYLFLFMLGSMMIILSIVIESYITPVFIRGISSFLI